MHIIKFDDEVVLEITDTDLSNLSYLLPSEEIAADLRRRLKVIIEEKIKGAKLAMRRDYKNILASQVEFIPTNPDALVEMIKAIPEYKNRDQRIEDERREREENERRLAELAALAEERQRERDRLASLDPAPIDVGGLTNP